MKQIKLTLDLETRRTIQLELGAEATRELVLAMAQAIVAVHLGKHQNPDASVTREGTNVDDE
mgnify:FL=1